MLHCHNNVALQHKDCSLGSRFAIRSLKMSEYGGIFDYALSADGYYALNFGFMVAYGLAAALIIPVTSYLSIRHRPLVGSAEFAA
jgi:hypothetical protein